MEPNQRWRIRTVECAKALGIASLTFAFGRVESANEPRMLKVDPLWTSHSASLGRLQEQPGMSWPVHVTSATRPPKRWRIKSQTPTILRPLSTSFPSGLYEKHVGSIMHLLQL